MRLALFQTVRLHSVAGVARTPPDPLTELHDRVATQTAELWDAVLAWLAQPFVWLSPPALVFALVAWRLAHRSSFDSLVGRRLRNRRVRWTRYPPWRWRRACLGCGLKRTQEGRKASRVVVPRVLRVEAVPAVDRVLVRLRPGMTEVTDEQAEALRRHLGRHSALWARVSPYRTRKGAARDDRLWLEFQHSDPLAEVVDPVPVPDKPDLLAVEVGVLESGEPWRVPLLGSHFLLIGATRAGKSSWIWALLRNLAADIRSGRVQVWAADKVGGIELGLGGELLARHVKDDPQALLAMLKELNARMKARAELMASQRVRVHVPTAEEPLIVLILDEMIAALAVSERGLRAKLQREFQHLSTQAAACGISMVAGAQTPLKEVLGPLRDFFTVKVGFRMNSSSHPDATFFDGARAMGATCDLISKDQQGVAIFLQEGSAEFGRGRVAYMSDAVVRETAQAYGPGATVTGRLRASIEGRSGAAVPLTAAQRVLVEALMRPPTEGESVVEVERPRSVA